MELICERKPDKLVTFVHAVSKESLERMKAHEDLKSTALAMESIKENEMWPVDFDYYPEDYVILDQV